MCFEHEIFFHWYSGYNNAKTTKKNSYGVTSCKKRRKTKIKWHGIDDKFVLDIDIDFQCDSTLVVFLNNCCSSSK
jgi:hypothetical protein